MKLTSNISDLIAKFTKLATAAQTLDVSAALTIGVNSARAKMANRIFNNGMDSELQSLGKYQGKKFGISSRRGRITDDVSDALVKKLSKKRLKRLRDNADATGDSEFSEYEKKRLSEGRQIKYKDLEFTGETRRSLKTQQEGNRVVAAFDNTKNAKIARYQEEQIGKIRGGSVTKIFSLSEDERALLKSETNAALNKIYAGLFSN